MKTIPAPVVYVPADDWVSVDRYYLACPCGIRSGATFDTAEEAAREFMHGGYRGHAGIAVWNGEIVTADPQRAAVFA